jgi:hypothetical protein
MTQRGKYWSLSEGEALCLSYLDDLMEADASMLGRYVYTNRLDPAKHGSNLSAVGGAIAGRLRKRGLVTFIADLKAWRITKAGRDILRDDHPGTYAEIAGSNK